MVIVRKSLVGFDFNLAKAAAPGLPSFVKEWSLNLLTEKIAVSLAAKKAERESKKIKIKTSIKFYCSKKEKGVVPGD